MATVKILDKEYKIKYTLRSIFIFEQITRKHFSVQTTFDQFIFFYSLIMANNQDSQLTFDEFIAYLDENPETIQQLSEFIEKEFRKDGQFEGNSEEGDSEKN